MRVERERVSREHSPLRSLGVADAVVAQKNRPEIFRAV